MFKTLFFVIMIFAPGLLMSQVSVGIGTTNPHSSAVLDIASSTKGILVPRMTQQARLAIASPANGLLVYDSTQHRLYQFQDGVWRYMLTSSEWTHSATHNWTYNTGDSIGLGTNFPTERLDVAGNIVTTHDLKADNKVSANGNIAALTFASGGNTLVNGNMSVAGNATSYNNIDLDDAGSTLQLQNNNIKKGFLQLSGNDLRFGTNSGNTNGKLIFRLNGTDAMSIDRSANIEMLQTGTGEGNVIVGWKVARASAPEVNMLPVVFGFVPADGGGAGWISPFGVASWAKVGTGKYEITCPFGITPYCSIVATSQSGGSVCVATYVSSGKFRIETFNHNGIAIDRAFTYIVNDPLNF